MQKFCQKKKIRFFRIYCSQGRLQTNTWMVITFVNFLRHLISRHMLIKIIKNMRFDDDDGNDDDDDDSNNDVNESDNIFFLN